MPPTRPMELMVLGAGPAYTDRIGATGAAYLIELSTAGLLLDFGQGSFPRLAAHRDPGSLTAVLVSHLHPDHFIDLVPLRHFLRYQGPARRRMTVLGPRDLEGRLDALLAEPGFSAEALDFGPLGAAHLRIGPFMVETALVTHTAESYAFRVTSGDGPGLVYSGDCGRADDLVGLIHSGDALLCEVSFGTGPVPFGAEHLDANAVAKLAATTGAGRVLLTHLLMGFDPEETEAAVRSGYDGDVRFVWPGDRLVVP
jgi:ribonuclease BN (tRNA processing enzyme)